MVHCLKNKNKDVYCFKTTVTRRKQSYDSATSSQAKKKGKKKRERLVGLAGSAGPPLRDKCGRLMAGIRGGLLWQPEERERGGEGGEGGAASFSSELLLLL